MNAPRALRLLRLLAGLAPLAASAAAWADPPPSCPRPRPPAEGSRCQRGLETASCNYTQQSPMRACSCERTGPGNEGLWHCVTLANGGALAPPELA